MSKHNDDVNGSVKIKTIQRHTCLKQQSQNLQLSHVLHWHVAFLVKHSSHNTKSKNRMQFVYLKLT